MAIIALIIFSRQHFVIEYPSPFYIIKKLLIIGLYFIFLIGSLNVQYQTYISFQFSTIKFCAGFCHFAMINSFLHDLCTSKPYLIQSILNLDRMKERRDIKQLRQSNQRVVNRPQPFSLSFPSAWFLISSHTLLFLYQVSFMIRTHERV